MEGALSQATVKDFVTAMRPLVESKGKSFCTYTSEAATVADAKLDKISVQQNYDVLTAMRTLAVNLSLKKTTVMRGLQIILAEYRVRWGFDQIDAADWQETICKRIRNLGRVVNQGETHSNNAVWVKSLPWKQQRGRTQEQGETQGL